MADNTTASLSDASNLPGLDVSSRRTSANQQSSNSSRVLPISSLRFVLAAIVVLGHLGAPPLGIPRYGLFLVARGVVNNLFDGPAAVIVFFVISGFCIHFPNRNGLATSSWKAYYARRYIRILIPMTVAIALAPFLHFQFSLFSNFILWSLLCEEIYYFLYPAILAVQSRIGWPRLLALTGALSLCVILTNPHFSDYWSYGPRLNWLLGLPCWLMGCHLAARFDVVQQREVSPKQIWIWRLGAWGLSIILALAAYHTPIGFPWTLNLFAIYGVIWMEREIAFYRNRPAPLFEGVGEASYSMYLVHIHGFKLAAILGVAAFSEKTAWVLTLVICAIFATLFYSLVERPSHRLARKLGRSKKQDDASPPELRSVASMGS